MHSGKVLNVQIRTAYQSFIKNESSAGVVLLVCAIIALIVANIPSLQDFQKIWDITAGVKIGTMELNMPLHLWVNDAMMAVFFFIVGLEIKREMLVGELAQPKQAALPILAAIGGMVFPAIIYTLFNYGGDGQNGWGIPMATDIAFAIGVLALLGKRCPLGLKVFLIALAIVDDLGAILVLAVFYPSHAISGIFLLYAAGVMGVLFLFNRAGVRQPWAYVIPGFFLWYFVYKSGIHATISGVLLAATIPAKTRINEVRFYVRAKYLVDKFKKSSHGQVNVLSNPEQLTVLHQLNEKVDAINPLMNRFETALHPMVNYFIMPLFALANAGVTFGVGLQAHHIPSVAMGIFFGLLLGKPIGIFLFCWLSVKLKIAKLPDGTNWKQLISVGIVGGIGFTMSLFIDNLAFTDPTLVEMGKAAILITSLVAAIIGMLAVSITGHKPTEIRHRKRNG